MCRSVGSPVIAKSAAQPLLDERVGAAVLDVLGLLVGHADEPDAHGVVGRDVVDGAHHRREAALHVVGAAADEPVALDARRELRVVRRHDVDVPVEDDARARGRADLGEHDRQAAELAPGDGDVARLEPALDEADGRAQAVPVGRVVGHQMLRENPFVHWRKGISREAHRGRVACYACPLRSCSSGPQASPAS